VTAAAGADLLRDVVAIAAERLGADAASVLSRLGGSHGHGSRATLPTKTERSRVLAIARAPVPEGLRAIHPTWIEHALEQLPQRARTALSSARTPTDVWLARWACAELPPTMTAPFPLDAAWLAQIGADQLAFALGGGARNAVDRLGEPLRAAIARIGRPPRVGQLGPHRAAIERVADLSLDDALVLVRLGSRALAPHIAANRLAQLQLTRALPRPLGIVVERELLAHSSALLASAPAWSALVAA
jgi:hypothetical protein